MFHLLIVLASALVACGQAQQQQQAAMPQIQQQQHHHLTPQSEWRQRMVEKHQMQHGSNTQGQQHMAGDDQPQWQKQEQARHSWLRHPRYTSLAADTNNAVNTTGNSNAATQATHDAFVMCPTLHYKEQCTPRHCIWCANKYSPWPGSDGVCISVEHAKELPSWTYKCKHIRPQ